ncbi:MAG: leucine-rich repeat protein [Paludibacter sp.]|nr:leucine-rich repeat protein [Paludibacter sp.]
MKKLFIALIVLTLTLMSMAQNSQTVTSYSAGTLAIQTGSFASFVTNLTITGNIDARDFVIIRDAMPQLQELDLSGANIQAYYGTEGTYQWGTFPANELPMYAFYNPNGGTQLWNLNTLKLPLTLTSIGGWALSGLYNLTSISIPTGVTNVGDYAFHSCGSLTSITLPDNLVSIGNNAFSSCYNLTGSINIPSTVTSIGNSIVGGCPKVTKFIVQASNPNYSSVDSVLFNKNQTTLLQCPEGKVGTQIIPNTVTAISDNAFQSCSKITGSITIPSSVTSIGNNSFYGCTGVTDFLVSTGNTTYASSDGVLFNKALTTLVKYPPGKTGSYSIPSSVTTIGNYAFYNCTKLTGDLIIPNTVTTIKEGAFSSCSGLNGLLTIGTGVSSIESNAFTNCTNIKVINCLRSTPPTTNQWTFNFSVYPVVYTPSAAAATAYKAATGWTNFPTILAPGFSVSPASISGLNYAPGATSSDAKYFTISGSFLTGDITINAPTNFEISTTSGAAFSPKTSLVLTQVGGIVAFDTIFVRLKTGLSANTYTGNTSITSAGITTQTLSLSGTVRPVPELANVTTAGTLSTLFSLSEKAAITKLKVTGSIDARDIKCMRDEMPLLAYLDLSEANIMEYTGNEGPSWYSTYLANSFPQNSFLFTNNWKGKTSLVSVKLPNSLTSIGENAFRGCTKITSITIGANVSSINSYAFLDCSGLKSINSLNETPPLLGEYVFGYNYTAQKVFVNSASALNGYRNDSKWSNFSVNLSGITMSTSNIIGLNYVPNNGPSDEKMITILGGMLQGNVTINSPINFEISTSPAPSFVAKSSITLNQVDGVVELDTIYVRLKSSLAANTYTGNLTMTSTGYTTTTIPLTGIVRNIPELINLSTAGALSASLSATEKSSITKLKLTGSIDARDFKCIRDELTTLTDLDLSEANVVVYNGIDGTYVRNSWEAVESKNYPAKTLPTYAFSNKKTLKITTLPAVLDAIGEKAFTGCGVKLFSSIQTAPIGSLTNMALSNSIVYVPTGKVDVYKTAWGAGTNVLIIDKDIEVIVNVTEAGKLATTIYNQEAIHPSLVTKLTVTGVLGASDITYIRDNMKQCYVVNLEGVNLTDLPADAFNGRSFLFTVKLPAGLKTIGSGAFIGCSNISVIDFPSTVTTIGNRAFEGCSSLKIIDAPASVNYVGGSAFYSCNNLTDVTFNSTSSIGYNAFGNCTGLKTLTITGSNSIGERAFESCSGLTNVSINGATSIGRNAFRGCSSLTSFDIPSSVTSIGDAAFQNCSKMDSLSIGAKVATIGANAFAGCNKLSKITAYRLTPATLGLNVFSGVNTQTCVLRILDEADFDAYFSAAQWGSFLSVQQINLTDKLGDSNEDNSINIVDVVNIVNYILEKPLTKFNMLYSDINKDGNINVIDVVQLVKQITSAPSGVPSMLVRSSATNNGIYQIMNGKFQAYFPEGLRGLDIEYSGLINASAALQGFSLLPYTKNGKQHLLGYTTESALTTTDLITLFELVNGTEITDMTFVADNGSPISMIQGSVTDVEQLKGNILYTIENGIIRVSDNILAIQLYALNGSLIANTSLNYLSVPNKITGVYLLKLHTALGVVSRKIVL